MTIPRLKLDTYEAILNGVLWEAQGSDEEDAKKHMIEWLNKHTNGYTINDFYFKHEGYTSEVPVVTE